MSTFVHFLRALLLATPTEKARWSIRRGRERARDRNRERPEPSENRATLDTDEERINVPCIQTYGWKKKLVVLMLPRSQGFLQNTKPLVLQPGKRFT